MGMRNCAWKPLKLHLHHRKCCEMEKNKAVFMKIVQGRQRVGWWDNRVFS